MDQKTLLVKYFDKTLPELEYVEGEKSDWIDLYARETVFMKVGDFKLIPLNVAIRLPLGYEAHLVPRSSLFKKTGCVQTNSMGVLDESYCGDNDEWMLPLYCAKLPDEYTFKDGVAGVVIQKGQRICQFRIMEHQPQLHLATVEKLASKDRGGFGTTG